MNKIKLLIHGGSGNRGCEAIIRGCNEIFGENYNLVVYSAAINQDINVGLDEVVKLKDGKVHYGKVLNFIKHFK